MVRKQGKKGGSKVNPNLIREGMREVKKRRDEKRREEGVY